MGPLGRTIQNLRVVYPPTLKYPASRKKPLRLPAAVKVPLAASCAFKRRVNQINDQSQNQCPGAFHDI
jgi:hypothetical protein